MNWDEQHAAVSRLEEHLAGLPEDVALPDLHSILEAADVPMEVVESDERARKVLHEAILARPLASHEAVERRRVEVELLTIEVGMLTATLRQQDADPQRLERARRRLAVIRERLDSLRRGL